MPAPYLGACICGGIQFRITSEPVTVYACHCTECQRHTGSAFAVLFVTHSGDLDVLAGAPTEYVVAFPEGKRRHGVYCKACATPLWDHSARRPGFLVVRAGTLAGIEGLEPIAHLWVQSKRTYVTIPAGRRQYQTQPNDPSELAALWSSEQRP